jgi:hypothetical protein
MAEQAPSPLPDHVKEYLLAEYRYVTESLWKVNDLGEKRVTFFVTLVTAVLAALVTLVTHDTASNLSHVQGSTRAIVLFALVGLLVIGYMTLLRMIHRNRETHEYELQLRGIYERFAAAYPVLGGYACLEPERARHRRALLIKYGGLVETVAAINGLLLAALVVLAASSWDGWTIGYTVAAGVASFGHFFWLQLRLRLYMTGENEPGGR